MDTFVVRVYTPGQDSPRDDDRLRGLVEEISTGSQATFHDAGELLSILYRPRRENPGVSPQRTAAPRATAPPRLGVSPDSVHQHSQPRTIEEGTNEA